MKCYLIAAMLLGGYAHIAAQACCCSSAGSNYTILPNLDKHVVGLRYSYSSYDGTTYPAMNMVMANGDVMAMTGNGTHTLERVNTLEVFGRFKLPRRFYISVFVPMHVLSERTESTFNRSVGLGDISLLLQYAFIDPMKCTGKKIKHQFKLGTGVKTPTGKFTMTPDGMFNTEQQMGTGSVDFLFNAIYTLRYKQFGVNVVPTYKKNLTNTQHFRFGDKIRAGFNAFYAFELNKNWTLTPTIGTAYMHDFENVYQKQKLTYTGGDYLNATAGLDIYFKQFSLSTSISPMLLSVLNWSGEPIQRFSFETGFYYNF